MIRVRITIITAIAVLATYFGAAFSATPSAAMKPPEIFQGGIVELKTPATGLSAVEGRFGKETVRFYPSEGGVFSALLGIDLEAKPGLAKVSLKEVRTGGRIRETEIAFKIKPRKFQQESFSVSPEFDQLSPEMLERIRTEQEQLTRVFATSAAEPLWQGAFVVPVYADISSPFGYRRIINGSARAPHAGVDLRAPMGTEVLAANRGRVVLLGDFFFSGNSLVLDHGSGLYTMYFHLSEFKVEQGAEVQKGDVIALSGMTGRVTGPHLHWGARLSGARVDPFELVRTLGASGKNSHPAAAVGIMEK
ncbi:MAG TPA: M23 family metallopeptidase [Candidatus Udaeobacter sp.]|nr:M23 family metallopeptidase [Candidatus Udaeobacter sp.]